MKRNVQLIGIIVVLLLMVGGATVLLPVIQEQIAGSGGVSMSLQPENEPIEIDLGGFLLGEELVNIPFLNDLVNGREVNPLIFMVASLVLIGGAVVTFGLVLALLMRITSRITTNTYEDEKYQAAVNTLETREKEENKELAKTQPPTPEPDHLRPAYQAYSSIAVFVFLVGIAAILIGASLNVDISIQIFAVVVTVIAAIIMFLTIRPAQFTNPEEGDNASVNWSTIWIAISGLVFLGIGLGLVVAIRSLVN